MITLTDGVVTLRAPTTDDIDAVAAMGADPLSGRWTSMPHPYERSHAQQWVTETVPAAWREETSAVWAVEADARYAGNIGVRRTNPPEIGFVLHPWVRGRGLMTRAVRPALRWAFEEARLPVVHWVAHAGNVASWRVAHACGFTFHGERPLSVPHRGELRDGWFASILPGDDPSPRTTWWPTPVLDGPTVRLRLHLDADLPRHVEACCDPRSRMWLPRLPDPYTEEAARRFVRDCRLAESQGRSVTWAIADRDDDRMLGNISVFDLDDVLNPTGGEIGFWAHPDARGRGVVGEAVELVVDHAFRPRPDGGLGRHRLMICAAWPNTASRHVAERAGFTLVGHHRMDGMQGDGTISDGAWYDLLATDPRPRCS